MNLRPRFLALFFVGFCLSACGSAPPADNLVTLVLDIAPTSLDPRIGVDIRHVLPRDGLRVARACGRRRCGRRDG